MKSSLGRQNTRSPTGPRLDRREMPCRLARVRGSFPTFSPFTFECDKLLCFFDAGDGPRGLADDQDDRVLVLGAILMDLLGKMGDEGTRRHRHGIGRIELVARANPPRALEHSDEAVVWVKVRTAEVVACEPFVDNDIKAGFFRIADQYRAPIPTSALPLDLIRQLVDDRCRMEFHRVCCSGTEDHRTDHNSCT